MHAGDEGPSGYREVSCSYASDRHSAADAVHPKAAKPSFANSRGDVQSTTAALHAALGVRLYLLTEFVLDQKLSKASWPAWNAVLHAVRQASEKMKQQALFRLPRVYRYSVKFLVASAILTDTFILGAKAGRMLAYSRTRPEWQVHVWFGALVAFILNVIAVWFVSLLVQALACMEMPFGSLTLHMPGLSYVCAAAETTLRMVTCRSAARATTGPSTYGASEEADIMSMLQELDPDDLLDPSKKRQATSSRFHKRFKSVEGLAKEHASQRRSDEKGGVSRLNGRSERLEEDDEDGD